MKKNYLIFVSVFMVTLVSGIAYAADVMPIGDNVCTNAPDCSYINTTVDQPEMADITCEEIGITKTLKYGNRNGQVAILQDVLINSGYYTGESTGLFDTATKSAVKMMQRAVSVKADGVVGPMTREAMRELCVSMVAGS